MSSFLCLFSIYSFEHFFLRYLLVSCASTDLYHLSVYIYTVSIWFEGYTTTVAENPMIVFQFRKKERKLKLLTDTCFLVWRNWKWKKRVISVFYIVQYIKEERRKKIFGGTRNAGRPQECWKKPAAAGIIIVVWRRLVEGQLATWGHQSCVVESSSWVCFTKYLCFWIKNDVMREWPYL